jgi:uncharacterized protein YkwD
MKSLKDLEKLKKEVINETNRIRSNPKSYIPILETYIKYFDGNILEKPDTDTGIETQEGAFAYQEAINFLKSQKPIEPLIYDEEVSKASQELSDLMGKTGNTGENAEDNNIEERISKYVDWDVAISENIDFGGFTGEDVIINLLVDDGVEDRSHRSNLFNTKIKYFGVGTSFHKEYEICTVIDYIGEILEYTNNKKKFFGSNNKNEKKYNNDFKLNKNNMKIGNRALDNMIFQATRKEKNENINNNNNEIRIGNDEIVEINNENDNPFYDDPDAPEGCIRRHTRVIKKNFKTKSMISTIKTYTIDDGSEEVVTIDEIFFNDDEDEGNINNNLK